MPDEFKDIDWSSLIKDLKDPQFIKSGAGKLSPTPSFTYTPLDIGGGNLSGEDQGARNAVIRVDVQKHPDFQKLNVLQRSGAKWAASALQLAASMGHIDAARMKRIIDFGAGSGGPTFAVARVGETIGADVEAVEQNEQQAKEIVADGILPEDKVHVSDGLAFLNGVNGAENGYDLVTAFMLGPDINADLFRKLAHASGNALSEGGNLLVTSDGGTFSAAMRACESSGVPHHFIHGVGDGGDIIVPHTLIIPKASCAAV